MSYILDALKKSEQERQIGHVPDISQLQELPKRAVPRWPRWLLLALLVNAVILVVLAWRTWDARLQSTVAVAPSTMVVPAPVRAPEPIDAAPPPPPPAVALPAPSAAPVMEPEQPLEPSAVANEPVYESATEAPSAAAMLAPPVTTSAPRWEDLPLDERANLPAPRIDVHVFAQEPERRFVLINLRKYRVGDTLDDGPSLVAILNDGIVLSYAGREYRVDRP